MSNRNNLVRIFAVLALMISGTARPYEDDVHRGLTEWLALQAGFPRDEAVKIAEGAVSYDHSNLSAVSLVIRSACLSRNADGSKLVQKYHFPGNGDVPGKSKYRVVDPGGPTALSQSNAAINAPQGTLQNKIRALGKALHPLEDSWSHGGEPDTPLRLICDEELSWGHPKGRGGWSSHDADLTHCYTADTVAMARATYAQLCKFADAVRRRNASRSSAACCRTSNHLRPQRPSRRSRSGLHHVTFRTPPS